MTTVDETRVSRNTGNPRRLLGFAERYVLLGLFVVICLVFTVNPGSGDVFASLSNINAVLRGQTAVAMIAIAAVFPLVTGRMDFSLGATAAMSMVLAAGLMSGTCCPTPPTADPCTRSGRTQPRRAWSACGSTAT